MMRQWQWDSDCDLSFNNTRARLTDTNIFIDNVLLWFLYIIVSQLILIHQQEKQDFKKF